MQKTAWIKTQTTQTKSTVPNEKKKKKLMKAMSLLKHVKHTSRTRFSLLINITKLKCVVSALETITHTFIPSHLDYYTSLTACLSKSSTDWPQLTQSAVASRSGHSASLHRPPVHFRIHRKIRVIAYRAIHGQAPAYISDLLNPDVARRSLRPSEQGLPPGLRTSLKTNGDFEAVAPGLWMHCLLIREPQPQNLKCS